MEKRRVILAGNAVPADWAFHRGVEEATGQTWDVIRCVTNRYDGLHKVTRYLKYFLLPVKLLLQRQRYAEIISWEQFFGLVLCFYLRLFRVKTAPVIHIMTFIYRPKRGLTGKIYERFVRYAVSSPHIRHIFVFGEGETTYYAEHFGLAKEKFVSEILGIEDRAAIVSQNAGQPDAGMPAGDYYLAAGRSNRDYDFLREAWPPEEASLYIVCDVERAEDAGNVKYLKDCHGDDYLRLLAGARAAVVPLKSPRFSSGQLVMLQAGMLGRPAIVTENDLVPDYLENGVTGFIIPKTAAALRKALEDLKDPAVYGDMCRKARRAFEARFSLLELGRRVGRRLRDEALE